MTATIECDACEYKPYCIARLNDRTVIGCGVPLWVQGKITKDEIGVRHLVRMDQEGSKE